MPGWLIGEISLVTRVQTRDVRERQAMGPHVGQGCLVHRKVAMPGAQQIENVQPALRRARAEPGEPIVADLRAVAVRDLMAGTGVVDRNPRCTSKPGTKHVATFRQELIVPLGQQPLHLPLRDRHAE